jgi:hypothetical protein
MEALLQAIAAKYGFEYAAKLLGLDQQTQNPKYAISMGGKTFDVGNMFKRAGLNEGIKAITGGSSMGMAIPLLAGSLGLAYLRNPLRPDSMNYNPELQGQIDYALNRGYIGTNSNSGLRQYSDNSILSGQNVVSLFGTNDYGKQLQKYKDKYYNTMSDKRRKQLDREIEDLTTDEFDQVDAFIEQQTTNNSGGGDGGGNQNAGGAQLGSGMSTGQHAAFRMARGGIASL